MTSVRTQARCRAGLVFAALLAVSANASAQGYGADDFYQDGVGDGWGSPWPPAAYEARPEAGWEQPAPWGRREGSASGWPRAEREPRRSGGRPGFSAPAAEPPPRRFDRWADGTWNHAAPVPESGAGYYYRDPWTEADAYGGGGRVWNEPLDDRPWGRTRQRPRERESRRETQAWTAGRTAPGFAPPPVDYAWPGHGAMAPLAPYGAPGYYPGGDWLLGGVPLDLNLGGGLPWSSLGGWWGPWMPW